MLRLTDSPEESGQAGASPARERETDRGQHRPQPFGSLTVPAGQPRYLLHEGPPPAHGLRAGEPPDPQPQYDISTGAGHISGKPQVGAVNTARPRPALRALGTRRSAAQIDVHHRDIHVHRPHHDVTDGRQQQLLHTEYEFIHGPGLSATQHRPLLVFRQLSEPPIRPQL